MSPSEPAYSIWFSTEAWRATGAMSRDQFGRLNRLLGSLADAAGKTDPNRRQAVNPNSMVVVEVSGVRATYTFDHAERVLHVVELSAEPDAPARIGGVR